MSEKKKFICKIKCPECRAIIEITKITNVLVPAVKAEKEETYIAEKSSQTTLEGM